MPTYRFNNVLYQIKHKTNSKVAHQGPKECQRRVKQGLAGLNCHG